MSTQCLRCSVIKQAGERMGELFDKKDEMKDGDYLKQTNCIKQIYDKLETQSCECEKKEYLHIDDYLGVHGGDEDGAVNLEILTDRVDYYVCEVDELLQMNCKQRYMIHYTEGALTRVNNGVKQNLFTKEKAYKLYTNILITGIDNIESI